MARDAVKRLASSHIRRFGTRLGRRSIAASAIVVVVLVGVAAVGALASRVAVASEAQIETTPTSITPAGHVADPLPAATTAPSPAPTPSPNENPTPVPTANPVPASTEPPIEVSTSSDASQSPESLDKSVVLDRDSGQEFSGQGSVFTWQDGDATRRLVLQTDLVVESADSVSPDDVVVAGTGDERIIRRQARHGKDAPPVFRSESGGTLMTLPGGVLLVLDSEWDAEQAKSFFARNGIAEDRTSVLGPFPNGFQIDTEPGFPSLELANALAGQDGVVLASPNWWQETVAR